MLRCLLHVFCAQVYILKSVNYVQFEVILDALFNSQWALSELHFLVAEFQMASNWTKCMLYSVIVIPRLVNVTNE